MCALWEKMTGYIIIPSKSIDKYTKQQKDLNNLLETAKLFSVPTYRLFTLQDLENKNVRQIRRFFSFLKRYRKIQANPESLTQTINSVYYNIKYTLVVFRILVKYILSI